MSLYLTSLEGNRQRLDGGAMFGNAPKTLWSRLIPPDDQNRIELACRSMLIESDTEGAVLFEVGIGGFFEPKLAKRYGVESPERHLLLEALEALGKKQTDINYVVLSHLHFDHAGGILPIYGSASQDLLFPNATYVVSELSWQRALKPHPRDRASFVPELTEKLKASQRLKLIKPGDVLWPWLEFYFTDGHTPGQMHSLVKGETKKVFFCGDIIPGSSWLHLPMTMGYDRFAERVIDEKTELTKKAIEDNWLLFYTHDHLYAVSYCKQDQGKVVSVDLCPSYSRIKL